MVRYAVRRQEKHAKKSVVSSKEDVDKQKTPVPKAPHGHVFKKMKKTDKIHRKRLEFLKKLQGVHVKELCKVAAERRSKSVVTGDMQPLMDALPVVEEVKRTKRNETRKTPTQANKHGKYQRRDEDIKVFRDTVKHEAFVKNPLQSVTEHLNNVMSHKLI